MSNKQKCIDMWQWIVDHPRSTKENWAKANPKLAREVQFNHHYCFACKETYVYEDTHDCKTCPVEWDKFNPGGCLRYEVSPYFYWELNFSKENAEKVLQCIKDTWL